MVTVVVSLRLASFCYLSTNHKFKQALMPYASNRSLLPLLMNKAKIHPMPTKNTPVRALAKGKVSDSSVRFKQEILLTFGLGVVGHVYVVIHHPAENITSTQRIKCLVVEVCDVPCHNSSCEKSNVLEAILLRTFTARDHALRS